MNDWTKADGARIQITFDQPLVGSVAEAAGAFTVTAREYTFVPGGALIDVPKTLESVEIKADDANSIVLHMDPKTRFESAVGEITVNYDGSGGLTGEGGSVAAFTTTFVPEGLIPKPHQNAIEHVEVTAEAMGTLTMIRYTDTKGDAHVEFSAAASGVLTHINDL